MLPYVTAAEVIRICQELMVGDSKQESKNKYPALNYTLDELKQYAGLPSEEVPAEVISNIDDCVLHMAEVGHSSYVEFNTKDNYTFKGTIVFCLPDTQTGDLQINEVKFNCYEDSIVTSIVYNLRVDAETGDGKIEFDYIASV